MDITDALRGLSSLQKDSGDKHSYIPSSFNGDEIELAGYPRPLQWSWKSVEESLISVGPSVVLIRLPLFWQVESQLWRAAQQARAPIFVNDKDNMPVGRSCLISAGADTVITDAYDSIAFSAYLRDHKTPPPRAWIVIQDISNIRDLSSVHSDEHTQLFQEIHLFPGMPVFVQCAHLSKMRSKNIFHGAPETRVEIQETARFFGPMSDPFPLINIDLSVSVNPTETCSCGLTTYRIE